MTCRAVGVGCGIAYVVRISRASLSAFSSVRASRTLDSRFTFGRGNRSTKPSSEPLTLLRVESISISLAAVKEGRTDAIKRIDEARRSSKLFTRVFGKEKNTAN